MGVPSGRCGLHGAVAPLFSRYRSLLLTYDTHFHERHANTHHCHLEETMPVSSIMKWAIMPAGSRAWNQPNMRIAPRTSGLLLMTAKLGL